MIKLENISKIYPMPTGDVAALRNISLNISGGDFLAIVGSSGSGKSTLMNILGCLDRPTSGIYELCGKNVLSLSNFKLSKIRNREIGFVFQGFNLLSKMTALENVELPMMYAKIPSGLRRKKALESLERVGLSERINHKPYELSGGQQQRVAIARAISLNPSVILADEPTGNLDPSVGEEVLTIFKELNSAGSTIVLITHDMNVAARALRIIEISDGKIIKR